MTGHGAIFFVNTSLLKICSIASSGVDGMLDNTHDTLGYLHSVVFGRHNSIRLPEKLLRRDFVHGHKGGLLSICQRAPSRSSSQFRFLPSLPFRFNN